MSDVRSTRRASRETKASSGGSRAFALAAHGENVVLVDTSNGRSWALVSDDGDLLWQPIAFRGAAERAPRVSDKGEAESE